MRPGRYRLVEPSRARMVLSMGPAVFALGIVASASASRLMYAVGAASGVVLTLIVIDAVRSWRAWARRDVVTLSENLPEAPRAQDIFTIEAPAPQAPHGWPGGEATIVPSSPPCVLHARHPSGKGKPPLERTVPPSSPTAATRRPR
jgi:hypothetical protein